MTKKSRGIGSHLLSLVVLVGCNFGEQVTGRRCATGCGASNHRWRSAFFGLAR